jgi:hypothetical protein
LQQDVPFTMGCEPGSEGDFAFVSLGPTNGAPRMVKKGESLERSYLITVAAAA